MEKFNNTTIFTGYLKQLLHNFNLPKYRVYTKKHKQYLKEHNTESPEILETVTQYYDDDTKQIIYPNNIRYIPYLKDDTIQEYIDGKWQEVGSKGNVEASHIHYYTEGRKILNYTKNLKITTNSYDSYTHEYLGDYLRFKRDYNNLDLMSLYNCFSNRQCDRLDLKITVRERLSDDEPESAYTSTFNTNDAAYKIYMIPVKLFREYTIAIDADCQIEMCCGLYGAYQDERTKFNEIPQKTYMGINGSYFSQPFLFSKLMQLEENNVSKSLLIELAQNEENLKLFLKVPANNNSTIVILEGNYLNWNDSVSNKDAKLRTNHTALNFEYLQDDAPFDLKTPLQLLRCNTQEQHPFSDRLIEYLLDNVITPIDEVNKNIARVQKVVKNQTLTNNNGVDENGNRIFTYYYEPKAIGFWDDHLKYAIYDYMVIHKRSYEDNHDILGYVDKDAEKYYQYTDDKLKTTVSLTSVELDAEEN